MAMLAMFFTHVFIYRDFMGVIRQNIISLHIK